MRTVLRANWEGTVSADACIALAAVLGQLAEAIVTGAMARMGGGGDEISVYAIRATIITSRELLNLVPNLPRDSV